MLTNVLSLVGDILAMWKLVSDLRNAKRSYTRPMGYLVDVIRGHGRYEKHWISHIDKLLINGLRCKPWKLALISECPASFLEPRLIMDNTP